MLTGVGAVLTMVLLVTAPMTTTEFLDPACEWLYIEGERVTVWVCDESSGVAQPALDAAERQLEMLERDLGIAPAGHVQLVLSDESLGMASGRAFVREGVAVVVRNSCPGDEAYLYTVTIPHEITHLALGTYSHRLPAWLREGLAMWSAPMVLPSPERAFTWGEMQYRAYRDVAAMYQWYGAADGVTRYVEREYGLGTLLDYLDTHANASIEDALRAVAGFNSAQIMELWRIEVGLEAAPVVRQAAVVVQQRGDDKTSARIVAWAVVGAHIVLLALLSWWRLRLRLRG